MQSVNKHRSPGMTAIYNAISTFNSNEVLDLGPCVAANFSFFSKLGCRFHFENVIGDLKEPQTCQPKQFLNVLKSGHQYNVVLMWDIWNYLSVDQQVALCHELEPHLKPNALLHSIHYVGANRPAEPAQFKVNDQYYIEMVQTGASAPNDNQASTIERLKALPNFQVLRSYINQQEMQGGIAEQILCYRPGRHMSKGVFSFSEMTNSQAQLDTQVASPAIEYLREFAKGKNGLRLLDIGGRSLNNQESWKAHFSEVYTVDMRQVLQRLKGKDSETIAHYLSNGSYLPFGKDVQFDVVVVWDYFNYMDNSALKAFAGCLAKHVKDASIVTSLNYNTATIPAEPRKYAVTEKGMGFNAKKEAEPVQRITSMLSSLTVQQCLPGFFIQSTYLAKPGMQRGTSEYILVYKDQTTQKREKDALYDVVMARKLAREKEAESTKVVVIPRPIEEEQELA